MSLENEGHADTGTASCH